MELEERECRRLTEGGNGWVPCLEMGALRKDGGKQREPTCHDLDLHRKGEVACR